MKGYRKWTVCVLALVLAFVLALAGKLTGEFATVATVSCGAFSLANAVGDHRKGGSA